MAIKIVSLKNATAVVGDEGKVTVTGEREEKGVLSAVTDIALMPTKINSDTTFVSESTAAVGSIAWAYSVSTYAIIFRPTVLKMPFHL